MTSPYQLPDQDFELLNAYLDDQLSPSARTALEQRLAVEPPLRAALDELQQTIRVLKSAPRLPTPRNFTLDPARYGRLVPWWARSGAMQLIGAIGAAASVILIVLGVAFSSVQRAPAAISVQPLSSGNAVAVNPTTTNPSIPNAVQDQAAILANTASGSPLTPKVAQGGQAVNPTLQPTTLPTFALIAPTSTRREVTPTFQAFAEAATPIPTATPVISNAAAPAGPPAPRPNSALGSSSGGAGAQNNGQVAPSNAPPSQTDQLAGAQPTESFAETQQTASRDMTQVAQQAKSNAQLQATASPADNKDQTAARAAEAATSAATSEAILSTVTSSATATSTSSPAPSAAAGIAAVPTALDKGTVNDSAARQASPPVPILLIAGIALLVFSVMLFALGWLRSRLSRQDR